MTIKVDRFSRLNRCLERDGAYRLYVEKHHRLGNFVIAPTTAMLRMAAGCR